MDQKTAAKTFVILMALCLLLSACGWNPATTSSAPETTPTELTFTDYKGQEDSLAGLKAYLTASGVLSGDGTEMASEFIGAMKGLRFTQGFSGSSGIVIEIYEYDLGNLNDTAKQIRGQVEESGKFEMLGKEVSAVLSGSGKYLMIYTDTNTSETYVKNKETAISIFKDFKK